MAIRLAAISPIIRRGIGMQSMAMLTDLYQLTMAYGYWKSGRADQEGVFHLFYRRNPFGGGYAVAAGLQMVIEYLDGYRFGKEDIEYLGTITGNDGKPVFDREFLSYLGSLKLTVQVDGIPEGTVVFPHEPMLRVKGSILQGQLLETTLLNIMNFQTLIATKASRVVRVAGGDPVLEFGLRRAQGPDGAMSASRAAYIGGCAATSNVLAGRKYGIPVRGTHAHSWVMSFDTELEAFEEYARVLPNNCVFLVDTYDTLEGVRNAIQVGRKLAKRGYRMVAYDQAALGGVYKLGAIRGEDGGWHPRVKISEQMIKTSNPGVQQVRRFFDADGMAQGDMIFDESLPFDGVGAMIEFGEYGKRCTYGVGRGVRSGGRHEDLLVPVMHQGVVVYSSPSIHQMRDRTAAQLSAFPSGVLRFDNPQQYACGLEESLHAVKRKLIEAERSKLSGGGEGAGV